MYSNPKDREWTPILPPAGRRVHHTNACWALATLALVLLTALGEVSAQEMQADLPAGSAVTALAPIAPPHELAPDAIAQSLETRKQHLREFYDMWQRKALEAGPPAEASAVQEVPEAGMPPPPDAPNGEITLERQQQEMRQ